MRILLVIPTHQYQSKYPSFLSLSDFPVGFAYLASALEAAGHQVFGLNPNNDPGYPSAREMLRSKLESSCREFRPEVVCLGGLCTDYAFLKDAIAFTRQCSPDTPVVLGGGIVTHDREFIQGLLRPDYTVSGEAEESLVQLVDALAQGRPLGENTPNLGYWTGSEPRFTSLSHRYIDLDQRAFPNYEPFGMREMLDKYSVATRYLYRYSRRNPRPMTIVTGRGCPFSCTFCVHQHGGKYRARKIDEVFRELDCLHQRYGFNVLIRAVLSLPKRGSLQTQPMVCHSVLRRDRGGRALQSVVQEHVSSPRPGRGAHPVRDHRLSSLQQARARFAEVTLITRVRKHPSPGGRPAPARREFALDGIGQRRIGRRRTGSSRQAPGRDRQIFVGEPAPARGRATG